MKHWWQRRSLKLRLAVWFTLVASATLLALIPIVYGLIEHRLHVELDRQLAADWLRAEASLKADAHVERMPTSHVWFDLWSGDGRRLSSHAPGDAVETHEALPAPGPDSGFLSIETRTGLAVRAMIRSTRLADRPVMLRVIRDESGIHSTLREILISFALAVPLIALLAAAAGYLTAGRMLRPISNMAERARQITPESLGQRLPVANPHDELGQLSSVFNQTLERLENSFASLRRFTADASHELRTPLTALRAVGEVAIRRCEHDTDTRESIGSMLEEAQRLNDLIDALLLIARAESGHAVVNLEQLSLRPLLADVRESVAVLAAEKSQKIDLDCDAGLFVAADRLLTRHAAMNILHNAILHSPENATVVLRGQRARDRVLIEVIDNGPGIAPEHQQRIFERFFRIDAARTRAQGGAGLGLAIAKLSVELQGGIIELDSDVGRGSVFRISLPHRPEGLTARREPRSAPPMAASDHRHDCSSLDAGDASPCSIES